MSAPPLVELCGVTCAYRSGPALEGVDLAVAADDLLGVVGPSGAGKTTLLRALAGRLPLTAGVVRRAPGVRLGYVPQVGSVDRCFPVTVRQVVLMGRVGRIWPWSTATERRDADRVLERLGVDGLGGRPLDSLSGGQQQRVFVARALVGEPRLLLLDEPTAGLDVRTRHELLHLLVDLHGDGLAVLLTTHDLNGIAAHLPRLVCLNRRVVARGAASEVLRADVLEATFGAPMAVLEHMGLPLVVERHRAADDGATAGGANGTVTDDALRPSRPGRRPAAGTRR